MTRLTVVGDALLDLDHHGSSQRLCPEAPAPVVDVSIDVARPGGAGLAAVLAARAGAEVTLVTALGGDRAGRRLRDLLEEVGVAVVDLGLDAPTPEKARVLVGDRVVVRLDRGRRTGAAAVGPVPVPARQALRHADGVVVADYGRGVAAVGALRQELADRVDRRAVVWDPHQRGADPVPGCWLVTPNDREALAWSEASADAPFGAHEVARLVAAAIDWCERWRARGVSVTRGDRGAVLVTGQGAPLVVPVDRVTGDPCGAGDCFAASAALALAEGALLSEAVESAVRRAAAFVAAGGARTVGREIPGRDDPAREGVRPATLDLAGLGPAAVEGANAFEVVQRIRSAGGTVVATGGCFDLLHAGHVALLDQARSLGDGLVVCLNADASVRRLKGSGRPVVPAADRARVLSALASVDAVVLFDDDTPAAVLDQLRPDIFVKGGDYAAAHLLEQAVVARWGGQVVTVPYVAGRSTTRMLQEASRAPT